MAENLPGKPVTVEGVTSYPQKGKSVTPEQVLEWVNQSIDDSGLQLKDVAFVLGVPQPHLTRLRNGEKPWTATKLARLPEVVQRRFLQLWSEALGVPADLATALRSLADAYDPLPKRASRLAKANLSRAGPQHEQQPVQTEGPARATGTGPNLKGRTK